MRNYQDPDLREKDVYAKKTAGKRASMLIDLGQQNKQRYKQLVTYTHLREQIDRMRFDQPEQYSSVIQGESEVRRVQLGLK